MPKKRKFNGYLTNLIKEYKAHYKKKGLAQQKEYILTITHLPWDGHNKQGFWPPSTKLRLRTINDMVDDGDWATINSTTTPQSYVSKMIAEEIKDYAKKNITIHYYLVRCPFSQNTTL